MIWLWPNSSGCIHRALNPLPFSRRAANSPSPNSCFTPKFPLPRVCAPPPDTLLLIPLHPVLKSPFPGSLLWHPQVESVTPSPPGPASPLAILSTITCLWLCLPRGPGVLQGWGRVSCSPSSPSTGDRPAQHCDSDGVFLAPDASQPPMKSCYCLPHLSLVPLPSPRGQDVTTSFTDSTDRQARFWRPPRDDGKERNFSKGCLAILY